MDFCSPLLRYGDGLVLVVIKCHQRSGTGGEFLPVRAVDHLILHGHGLVANSADAHSHAHILPEIDRCEECDLRISDDDAHIQKRLVFREQPQMDQIRNARLLEKSQEARVVDVTLRVQVAVTNFDGVEEPKFAHN